MGPPDECLELHDLTPPVREVLTAMREAIVATAVHTYPDWAGLVEAALTWRAGQWTKANADGAATVPATRSFIAAMAALAK